MTMHSASRPLACGTHFRPLAALGRLFEAFVNALMRHRMKRVLHSMSDRLLADIGITRGEIDAAVDGFIPRSHGRCAR
jgi:uncharacterized protein YjiS (DUF1127 family)